MLTISDILGSIFQGGTFTAMARVVDWSNNPLTVVNTTSVSLTITDPNGNPVTHFTNLAILPTAVIYPSLQTPSWWTADTIGFNFAHTIDVSVNAAFASTGLYSVQYTIQPVSGQAIIVRYAITVF
jgi:hypothetical protein